jgi:histone H3/H4
MASDVLVVASKVKEYIKSRGAKTSGETIPALSEMLSKALDEAINRARANKRSTVKPCDL